MVCNSFTTLSYVKLCLQSCNMCQLRRGVGHHQIWSQPINEMPAWISYSSRSTDYRSYAYNALVIFFTQITTWSLMNSIVYLYCRKITYIYMINLHLLVYIQWSSCPTFCYASTVIMKPSIFAPDYIPHFFKECDAGTHTQGSAHAGWPCPCTRPAAPGTHEKKITPRCI
jgi:hypothetical protein